MYRFEQRRDPARLMWRRLSAVVLLIILTVAVRGVWGVYQKERESRQIRAEAEAKLNDLKQREAELRADISLLSTDRGVEEELRERYDLTKNNEGVVVIVEPPTSSQEVRPSTFQRWKSMFSF